MAWETLHVVQSFHPGKGDRLIADATLQFPTPERARREAEKLAAIKPGVIAFSASGDAETGDYDERPAVLFRFGRLPTEFEE